MPTKNAIIPADTFIPKPARIIAIAHLCIAFTTLLFIVGYPFMGYHYALKSRLLIYDAVIQDVRFNVLHTAIQEKMLSNKEKIHANMGRTFLTKLSFSVQRLGQVQVFEKAWLLLSIILPILILLKIDGAAKAAWVLPLLAFAFAIDNYQHGIIAPLSVEEKLFPSEKNLEHYLGRKISSNILLQKEDLLRGWHIYLIKEWTEENPSSDLELFKKQVSEGEFAFNLERSLQLIDEPISDSLGQKEHFPWLLSYLIWNVFFAYFINKRKWKLT